MKTSKRVKSSYLRQVSGIVETHPMLAMEGRIRAWGTIRRFLRENIGVNWV